MFDATFIHNLKRARRLYKKANSAALYQWCKGRNVSGKYYRAYIEWNQLPFLHRLYACVLVKLS